MPPLKTPTKVTTMIRSRFVRSLALILTASVALSCAENSPTAPVAVDNGRANLLSDLLNPLQPIIGSFISYPEGATVSVVTWGAGHANVQRQVSGTIGPFGGTLVIPGSDFTITFPIGAVLVPTNVTIVSESGPYISYDMQPHGTQFLVPVTATQGLTTTSVYGTPAATAVRPAYSPDGWDLIGLNGTVTISEIESSVTYLIYDLLGQPTAVRQTWSLNHFSRYMLASG